MTPDDRDFGERLAQEFSPDQDELDRMEARVSIPETAPGIGWPLAVAGGLVVAVMVAFTLIPASPPESVPEPPGARTLAQPAQPPPGPTAPTHFRAEEGTEVAREGFRLVLPPEGVRTRTGEPVTGEVELRWRLNAPEAPPLPAELMAGSTLELHLLRGEEPLEWDGVAELELPVPEDAGDLDLYHFDEVARTWVYEEEGAQEAGVFRAELHHFSWWASAWRLPPPPPPPPPAEPSPTAEPEPVAPVVPAPAQPPNLPRRLEVPQPEQSPWAVLPLLQHADIHLPEGHGKALLEDLYDLGEALQVCHPDEGWLGEATVSFELREKRAREVEVELSEVAVARCVRQEIRAWHFTEEAEGAIWLRFSFHERPE